MTWTGQARGSEIDGKVGEREVEIKALARRNVPIIEAAGLSSLMKKEKESGSLKSTSDWFQIKERSEGKEPALEENKSLGLQQDSYIEV